MSIRVRAGLAIEPSQVSSAGQNVPHDVYDPVIIAAFTRGMGK